MGQRPTVLKSCAVATKNEQTGAQAPLPRPGALADRFTDKMKRTALLGGPFLLVVWLVRLAYSTVRVKAKSKVSSLSWYWGISSGPQELEPTPLIL